MADRKRRRNDAVNERRNRAYDRSGDADDVRADEAAAEDLFDRDPDADDLAADDLDADEIDVDTDDLAADDLDADRPARTVTRRSADRGARRTTLTKDRPAPPRGRRPTKAKGAERPNIFARLANFVREVVAELRKVIWPTRKELLTYAVVVVVFVTIMVAIVAALDWVFAKGVLWAFGNGDTTGSR